MTLGILSIVLAMLFTVLVTVQNGLARQATRSQSNDQARLAVQELDREIRSGNVLYNPSLESDSAHFIYPGMSLRIYTQANAPTREAGGQPGERCVQWRIKKNKIQNQYELQRREWVRDAPSSTAWQVVATNIMNRATNPQQTAFSVDPLKRIVNVNILVNARSSNGSNAQVETTVEGRNTVYGANTGCEAIPTYPVPDPAES